MQRRTSVVPISRFVAKSNEPDNETPAVAASAGVRTLSRPVGHAAGCGKVDRLRRRDGRPLAGLLRIQKTPWLKRPSLARLQTAAVVVLSPTGSQHVYWRGEHWLTRPCVALCVIRITGDDRSVNGVSYCKVHSRLWIESRQHAGLGPAAAAVTADSSWLAGDYINGQVHFSREARRQIV